MNQAYEVANQLSFMSNVQQCVWMGTGGQKKISFDRYILYRDRYSTINQSTG